MERLCKITLEISGYKQDQEKEIIKACMIEWNFGEDDFFHQPDNDGLHMILGASAIGSLYADYDERDIIGRLKRAVWRINGGMCRVECTVSKTEEVNRHQDLTPFEDPESLVA